MTKTLSIALACCLISLCTAGQRITQREAKAIFNTTVQQLKTNDTAGFANMWVYDDVARPHQESSFTRKHAAGYFEHIKEWMDTAFNRNLPIDYIDIERRPKDGEYEGAYLIKAWYRYDETYAKGFGFYVYYVDGKWRFKFNPETSLARRG